MNNSPAIQAQGRDLFTLRKLLDRICTHVHKKRNELKIYEENDNELNFFKRTKSVMKNLTRILLGTQMVWSATC